jgi:hypothetical protein
LSEASLFRFPPKKSAREFNAKLKTLACPHCGEAYTDFTAEWLHAYLEGRRDALNDLGTTERDGPVKLKCELCGGRAITNVFLTPPKAI